MFIRAPIEKIIQRSGLSMCYQNKNELIIKTVYLHNSLFCLPPSFFPESELSSPRAHTASTKSNVAILTISTRDGEWAEATGQCQGYSHRLAYIASDIENKYCKYLRGFQFQSGCERLKGYDVTILLLPRFYWVLLFL